jgi:PIN domain nuclease of toxin-antitoxin system
VGDRRPGKVATSGPRGDSRPFESGLFSAASIWEIAIKSQLRRRDFSADPAEVAGVAVESGFDELPIRAQHCALTTRLPEHHRDPFDRVLIAQAITEPVRLLTVDRVLAEYSELVLVL